MLQCTPILPWKDYTWLDHNHTSWPKLFFWNAVGKTSLRRNKTQIERLLNTYFFLSPCRWSMHSKPTFSIVLIRKCELISLSCLSYWQLCNCIWQVQPLPRRSKSCIEKLLVSQVWKWSRLTNAVLQGL